MNYLDKQKRIRCVTAFLVSLKASTQWKQIVSSAPPQLIVKVCVCSSDTVCVDPELSTQAKNKTQIHQPQRAFQEMPDAIS